jgi:hypothetical protein
MTDPPDEFTDKTLALPFCVEIFVAFRPVHVKAASRGIPLAAALQIRPPDSRRIGIELNCSF